MLRIWSFVLNTIIALTMLRKLIVVTLTSCMYIIYATSVVIFLPKIEYIIYKNI